MYYYVEQNRDFCEGYEVGLDDGIQVTEDQLMERYIRDEDRFHRQIIKHFTPELYKLLP